MKKLLLSLILTMSFIVVNAQIVQRGIFTYDTASRNNNNSQLTLTINKPVGLAVGDFMLLQIIQSGNDNQILNVIPTGWAIMAGSDIRNTSNGSNFSRCHATIVYKFATSTDIAALNFQFSLDNNADVGEGAIIAFSGVDTNSPFDTLVSTIYETSVGGTLTASTISTNNPNSAIIMFGAIDNDSNISSWSSTNPGILNELYDLPFNGSRNIGMGAAWKIKPNAGATGTASANITGNNYNGTKLLALKAAPLGPTLVVTPTALDFGIVPDGNYSIEQNYVLSGTNLDPGIITINAPANFEVSLSSESGFASSLNVTNIGGTLNNTNIYVRFNPSSPNTNYSGNISNTGGGASIKNVNVIGTSITPSNCTAGSNNDAVYINNVQINTINNNSGATSYSDFRSISTDLKRGDSYPITLTRSNNNQGNSDWGYAVWIDYNFDGDFNDSGEQVFTQSPTLNLSVGGTISVPTLGYNGFTTMRIAMERSVIPNECGTFGFGEVEDYTINLLPACALPVARCQNIELALDANGNAILTPQQVDNADNLSTYECGLASMAISETNFNCFNLGQNNVTLTVTDIYGNQSSCTATVTVVDNINPLISCPSNIDNIEATSAAGAIVNYTTPVGSDNCSETTSLIAGLASGNTFPIGETTVTYQTTDTAGNTDSCSFTVTVIGEAPQIICPGDVTVSNETGQCGAIVSFVASDSVGIPAATITYSNQPGSVFPVGVTLVTATATNAVGSSSCTFTVTVTDDENPTIACANTITVSNDSGQCSADINITSPVVSDNCASSSTALDFDGSNDRVILPNLNFGSEFTVAAWIYPRATSYSRILTKYSGGGGNSGEFVFDTYDGSNPPSNANGKGLRFVFTGSNGGGVTSPNVLTLNTWNHVAATFNNGVVKIYVNSSEVNSGTTGFTSIPASALNLVIGEDNTIGTPEFFNGQIDEMSLWNRALPASEIFSSYDKILLGSEPGLVAYYNFEDGMGSTVLSDNSVNGNNGTLTNMDVANDWVSSNAPITQVSLTNNITGTSDASGVFPLENTTVTWTATDAAGNSSICTQVVTVTDNEAPTLSQNSAFVDFESNCYISVPDLTEYASDNCSIVFSQSPIANSPILAVENDIIEVTIYDESGNGSVFNLTVHDATPPVLSQNASDIDFENNCQVSIPDLTGFATDNCSTVFTQSPSANSLITAAENDTIEVSIVDSAGNSSIYTLTVHDITNPVVLTNNMTVQLNATGMASITAAQVDNNSTDNCSIASYELDNESFNCSDVGENIVTLTITDISGNTASAAATITVEDNVLPTAICQNITVQLDASGNASITASTNELGNSSSEFSGTQGQDNWTYGHYLAYDSNNFIPLSFSGFVWNNPNVGQPLDFPQLDANGGHPASNNFYWAVRRWTSDFSGNIVVSGDFYDRNTGCGDGANVRIFKNGTQVYEYLNIPGGSVPYSVTMNISIGDNIDFAIDPKFNFDCDDTHFTSVIKSASGIDNGSNDACGIQSLALDITAFTCANVGDNPVILTVTDINGNVSTCNAVVTVEDNINPVINVASDLTVQCDGSGNVVDLSTWLNNNGGAVGTDACGIVWSNNFTALSDDCGATGSATVTFTATDPSNNSVSTTATFTIEDTTDPTWTVEPSDMVSVECDPTTNAATFATWLASFSGTDGCGSAIVTHNSSGLSNLCGGTGTETVTFTLTDECGNDISSDATFTIIDTTPPTISVPADVTIECTADESSASNGAATGADSCGNVIITQSDASVSNCGNTKVITRTWTATDDCGNATSGDQTITIIDTTPPTISVPADATIECTADESSASNGAATGADSCGNVIITQSDASVSNCGNTKVITRTWTATDDCGNATSADQTITVIDTTPPTISVPADATIECTADESSASNGAATGSDSCGSVTISQSDVISTGNQGGGDTVNLLLEDFEGTPNFTGGSSTTTNGLFPSDSNKFVSSSKSRQVSNATSDIVFSTVDASSYSDVSFTARLGAFSGNSTNGMESSDYVIVSISTNGGASYSQELKISGSNTANQFNARWGFTGVNAGTGVAAILYDGNNSTSNFAPAMGGNRTTDGYSYLSVTNLPSSSSLKVKLEIKNNDSNEYWIVDDIKITGVPSGTVACGNTKTITRTWTATDDCGNTTSADQTITVVDTTPPTLTVPADVTIECTADESSASNGEATGSDTCGNVVITQSDATVSNCGNTKVITRTWTATDDCGNATSTDQTITVVDTTPPSLSVPADVTIECSENESSDNTGLATGSDTCGNVIISQTDAIEAGNVTSTLLLEDFEGTPNYTGGSSTSGITLYPNDSYKFVSSSNSRQVNSSTDNIIFSTVDASNHTDVSFSVRLAAFSGGGSGNGMEPDDYVIVSVSTDGGTTYSRELEINGNSNAKWGFTGPSAGTGVATVFYDGNNASSVFAPSGGGYRAADGYSFLSVTGLPSSSLLRIKLEIKNNASNEYWVIDDAQITGESSSGTASCGNTKTIIRTWTATDECGNTTSADQTITVVDTTPPTLTVPADVTIECTADESSASNGEATGSDTCGNVVITQSDATVSNCGSTKVITRTWTATDDCGNATSADQTITVIDTTPPTLTVPADVTIECTSDESSASNGIATGSDTCGTVTISQNDALAATSGTSTLLFEDFEDATVTYSPSNADDLSRISNSDYYGRIDNNSGLPSSVNYSSQQGLGFYGLQDTDGATIPITSMNLDFNGINISGKTNLQLSLFVAEDAASDGNQDWDSDSSLKIEVQIDGGGYNTIFAVESEGTGFNSKPRVDTDFNGIGDGTEITNVFSQFMANIAGTGNSMDVRISFANLDDGDEDIAIDNVMVTGDSNGEVACGNTKTIIRTWTATDECGNATSADQIITVVDTTPPTWTVEPSDTVNVECDGTPDPNGAFAAWLTSFSGTDTCGTATVTNNSLGLSDGPGATGTETVTFTLTDDCGNSIFKEATFTIVDTTPPTITCPANMTLNCEDDTTSTSTGEATSADTCSDVTITQSDVSTQDPDTNNAGYYNYTITRTWTATDATGNTTSCDQTITVQDVTPPTITCPSYVTLNCEDNTTSVSNGVATGSDICSSVAITQSDASTQNPDANTAGYYNYTITRTWTATDVTGNATSCVQTITVQDVTPPTISCPENITLNCEDDTTSAATGEATGSDICSGVVITQSDASTQNPDANTAGYYNYAITRTWTATDVTGNATSCVQTITVQDITPPVVDCLNLTVTLDSSGDGSIVISDINNGSYDNCSPVTLSLSQTNFDCSDIGGDLDDLIISEYVDGSGFENYIELYNGTGITVNLSEYSLLVYYNGSSTPTSYPLGGSVDDRMTSVISHPSATYAQFLANNTVLLDFDGNDAIALSHNGSIIDLLPVYTSGVSLVGTTLIRKQDVNNGNVSSASGADGWLQNSSAPINNLGSHVIVFSDNENNVELTVTDTSGNISTCIASVTVIDNTPPVVACQNITVQLNASGNVSITADDVELSSSDACGIASLALDTYDFTCANVGENTVTLTATDSNGNFSTCTATVTVADNVPPVAVAQGLILELNASGNASITAGQIDNGSSDACGISSITVSPSTFTCSNVGPNTVTLTVTDNNSNVATATAIVIVEDNVDPVAVCQNISVALNANGYASIIGSHVDGGSTDACGIASFEVFPSEFGCGDIGANNVTLTVTDVNGNVSTCDAVVTITGIVPIVTISQSALPEFCQGAVVVLTANTSQAQSDIRSYAWSGTGVSGPTNGQSVSVSGNGTYTVVVTSETNCSTTQTYTVSGFDAGALISSYTILALDEVYLHGSNLVQTGAVGAKNPGSGTIKLHQASTVVGFAQAPNIVLNQGSTVGNAIYQPATPTIPTFLFNTQSTTNSPNVTVNNNQTQTLTGSVYKLITIKQGATVTFTQPNVYINEIKTFENATINFAGCANVYLNEKFMLARGGVVNSTGENVVFYVDDDVQIEQGSNVRARIHLNGNEILAKGASANGNNAAEPTYMTGLFIANRVHGNKNVIWNADPVCEPCSTSNGSQPPVANGNYRFDLFTLTAWPNPSDTEFNIKLKTENISDKAQIKVFDMNNKLVHSSEFSPSETYRFGKELQSGVYIVKVTQGNDMASERVVKY